MSKYFYMQLRYISKNVLSFRRIHHKAFGKYLLLTNTITSGILMGIGDIVQQEIEFQNKKLPKRYNYSRLTRMFIVGLSQGPLHHYYYGWLNKVLPKRNLISTIKKIGLDQFLMSPICILSFFYGMDLLEFKSLKDTTKEIQDKFLKVYMVDWCIWPPAQFLNFHFVPTKYQVVYINFITMLYNVFLSYIKHKEIAEEYKKKTTIITNKSNQSY